MSKINSILFNTDSYKVSMWKQYPAGTEYVYSYIEARSNNTTNNWYGYQEDGAVFMGIQPFIRDYLSTPITAADVALADAYWTAHGEPFNREGWDYIVREHGGFLPISIKAVPEGSVIPLKNVLCVVQNTDPKVPWLTTWVETALLRAIWYPSSVATLSRQIKKLIKQYLEDTGDVNLLDFKLHDFGARGAKSNEAAALGGLAHLVNFKGTDTYVAVIKAVEAYGADVTATGFSIPAAEHSTITSWGKENEATAFENMVSNFSSPGSIYAVVSDSYDIYQACETWGTTLKDKVIAGGGTLVIRPDSGEPTEVLPKMLEILDKHFGHTVNAKGFKVLNTVRLIWGDGINFLSIWKILHVLFERQWSADNIAFGMGGALLDHVNRDSLGWAMKCSAIGIRKPVMIDWEEYSTEGTQLFWQDVYKDPVTASSKASKKGRVTLHRNPNGTYYSGVEDWDSSVLKEVFRNGKLLSSITFEEVRNNAKL